MEVAESRDSRDLGWELAHSSQAHPMLEHWRHKLLSVMEAAYWGQCSRPKTTPRDLSVPTDNEQNLGLMRRTAAIFLGSALRI